MRTYQAKKIPGLLALLILIFGIGGGIYFAETSLDYLTQAQKSNQPQEVRLTNKTHSMVSISWITEKSSFGLIKYNTAGRTPQKIAFDDRKKNQETSLYKTHHVSLRNLQPETQYEFFLEVDGKRYDNNGKPYLFTTLAEAEVSKLLPAYGEVLFADNSPAAGALVYLTLEKAGPLSALVNKSGNWLIPLNIARDKDNGSSIAGGEKRKIELFIITAEKGAAQAITTTEQVSPASTIVVGKRYDFRLKAQKEKKQETEILGAQKKENRQYKIEIIQPEKKQALSSQRPLIRGTGFPGNKVSIILQSRRYTVVVDVDKRGNWSWTPPKNLQAGNHVIIIKTRNKEGAIITLRRQFVVLKSGTRVLGEATPSATLAPSAAPSPTATLTPFASPTPTSVFGTPTPTLSQQETPRSGSWTLSFLCIGLGFIFISLGIFPGLLEQRLKFK